MNRSLPLGILLLVISASTLWADPKPEKLVVATWNLEWFFDNYTGDNYAKLAKEQSAPSREEWDWRLDLFAEAIAEMQPTILAVQEVENQRVLFYLTRKLKNDYKLDYKIAFVEGTDYFTEQDVGLLYRGGLVEVGRREMSKEMADSKEFYILQKHVIARFEWGTGDDLERLTLMNVHFRATPEGGKLRTKQSKLVRHYLNERISKGENVIVIGDLNTEEAFDETTKDGDVGTLRGLDTPSPDDDLTDLHEYLPKDERVTHIIGKQFDRILVSKSLLANDPKKTDLVFKSMRRRQDLSVRGKQQDKDHWNIYYTIPQDERDVSDHFPLVAEFEFK